MPDATPPAITSGSPCASRTNEHASTRFRRRPRSADKPVIVTLKRSRKVIEVPASTTILDAVEAAGVAAPSSCRVGNCGMCAVKVTAGTPEHRDNALSDVERADNMCICVSRASGDTLELDL